MAYTHDLLTVKPTGYTLAQGRMLVAVPFHEDAFFYRSLVLLTDYDKDNCAGLILNRRLPYTVHELVEGLEVHDSMFFGGPVLPSALFLLHNFENCAAAAKIVPNIYVGYDKVLLALIENHAMETMSYRFLMGYAGWSPGQLENELKKQMWVVGNPPPDLVFKTAPE